MFFSVLQCFYVFLLSTFCQLSKELSTPFGQQLAVFANTESVLLLGFVVKHAIPSHAMRIARSRKGPGPQGGGEFVLDARVQHTSLIQQSREECSL